MGGAGGDTTATSIVLYFSWSSRLNDRDVDVDTERCAAAGRYRASVVEMESPDWPAECRQKAYS